MASRYGKVYCVRRIREDPRKEIGICKTCNNLYNINSIGKYCKEDGEKISKHHVWNDLEESLIAGDESLEILEPLLFGKKIISHSSWAFMTESGHRGNLKANIPSYNEIRRWEKIARNRGIEFVKNSEWILVLEYGSS